MHCILNQLPIELIHQLFHYFSASELFFTFLNLNDHINAILKSYSSYRLDFRSISKSDFRRICRHVHPEQIISLVLSDGNDTSGQTECFFARFQIEQFTRLRSLKLVEIEFNSLQWIFPNVLQLQQLRSFSFAASAIRHTYQVMQLSSSDKLKQINTLLCNTYAQLFPQLNYLDLNGGWVLNSIPLTNLLRLKVDCCTSDKLEQITNMAPNLRSLDVYILSDLGHILFPVQLTYLNLKISSFQVTLQHMEALLLNRVNLKHVVLEIFGKIQMIDGESWQALTKSLTTFNFKFRAKVPWHRKYFDSFRTRFWLEDKRWFVAYHNHHFFSVPYFTPKEISSTLSSPIFSTAILDSIFYKNTTKLIVGVDYIFSIRYLSPEKLSSIQSLSILSIYHLESLTSVLLRLPQLYELTVNNIITLAHIQPVINKKYIQIHTLNISIDLRDEVSITKHLVRLFPMTKKLIYQSDIQSIETMTRFIDGFTQLTSASFISKGPLYNFDRNLCLNPDLFVLKSHRSMYGLTICRIYFLKNSTSLFYINWWIEM